LHPRKAKKEKKKKKGENSWNVFPTWLAQLNDFTNNSPGHKNRKLTARLTNRKSDVIATAGDIIDEWDEVTFIPTSLLWGIYIYMNDVRGGE
jgi:hypothetical protein